MTIILFDFLQQAATEAPPRMDLYTFILALIDRPVVVLVLTAVAGLLGVLVRRWETALQQARREIGATREELHAVHEKVDGTASELRKVTERAAHAEGKIEGIKEAPPPPPAVVVVPPVVASQPRSGQERTRISDRPTEPAPPEPPPYDGPPL